MGNAYPGWALLEGNGDIPDTRGSSFKGTLNALDVIFHDCMTQC